MKDKILFIDRDGTLINEPIDTFQVDSINKLIFKKYVISSLRKLIMLDYKLIMVTNQDKLGSKGFTLESFNKPHFFMLNIFRSEDIIFDDILICSHVESDNCECRKPKIKMLEPWLGNIDKNRSYVIGDRDTDMMLAKNMQITGLQYEENAFNWIHIVNKITKNNRYAEICRKTKETAVQIQVSLDSEENSQINTGIKFFDHMLDQLAVHSGIYMNIFTKGDIDIDDHHTVEDTAIALGTVLFQALGKKNGLCRFGFYVPMDESQSSCIIDISNRPYLKFQAKFNYQIVGDLNTDMIEHFFYSLAYSMKITLHLCAKGENDHHCIESLFKAFGRALREAIKIEGNKLPTSKGLL
ncbi:imidazoleglycerol-phosphate dehydratase [Buchnera aphidicola (Diuraphis noxia)]|uniref:Imidazoleglycerol-phosphate dehydratase n=1 Tax=Buchnera aphidicola subsp. Diuraphis noxia TaxID=118101 RepID=A0A1B2H7Z2_BUCDN|nr:bifunctional histidinol-phosphatase/imidazoleglycerol-phosphate dehydratase HisB [Buchnera aphidicola]ANZ22343.1 imidazoleglycerol-phosphate dehydratase [Buchnera aphidicola (Diuraphis noxia)]